jgi:GTPase SAR1 family protein
MSDERGHRFNEEGRCSICDARIGAEGPCRDVARDSGETESPDSGEAGTSQRQPWRGPKIGRPADLSNGPRISVPPQTDPSSESVEADDAQRETPAALDGDPSTDADPAQGSARGNDHDAEPVPDTSDAFPPGSDPSARTGNGTHPPSSADAGTPSALDDADLESIFDELDGFRRQGYRTIGVLGLRGSGKTVFVVRLIEAMLEVRSATVTAGSQYWGQIKELNEKGIAPRTDEFRDDRFLYYYAVIQPAPQPPLLFIDISGEHFDPKDDSDRGRKARIMEYLRECSAYIFVYPMEDEDTYSAENDFHEKHLQMAVTHIIGAGVGTEAVPDPATVLRGPIDKPLSVVFSKADLYAAAEPGRDSPLEIAQRRFRAFDRLLGWFRHVRFSFISTGDWVWDEAQETQYLDMTSSPQGLLDALDHVEIDLPTNVESTRELFDAQRKMKFLAWVARFVPGLGREIR